MPSLSQLAPAEIQSDLEVLLAYRRGFGDALAAGGGDLLGGLTAPAGTTPIIPATGPDGTFPGASVAAAPPPSEVPFAGGPGVLGMGEPRMHSSQAQAQAMGPDYARSMYELEQRELREREHARNREHPQAFNDHLAAHQYSSSGIPGHGAKLPSNGRDREGNRERSKKYAGSAGPPPMGHGGYGGSGMPSQHQQQHQRDVHPHGGYPHSQQQQHSHRQGMDQYGSSPGLGLQNMQRLPDNGDHLRERDGMVGIQHMPLPPAPSTIPTGPSGNSKQHHHHNHHPPGGSSVGPVGTSGHAQGNQHPSLNWEGSRRERERERDREREREVDIQRERSHSSAGRAVGYAQGPPPPPPGSSSTTGRSHSHSVSSHTHPHAHYHSAHGHSRSSVQGSGTTHAHAHSVMHTHPHSHSHTGPTSHLHVIHNHGPGPTTSGTASGGNGGTSSSARRYEDPSASANSGHRSRASYPSGPSVDRDKELRERERLAGAPPSMNVMHPSLSHGGTSGQERERHSGYSVPQSSREPWNDRERERERPKERDERRERERERDRGHPMSMSSLSGHSSQQQPQQPQQQQQQQRGGRPDSHAPPQGSYPQASSSIPNPRYSYNGSAAYSPPSSQPSQSRRNSPPPLLPPVPNTSRYNTTHRRPSPAPADSLTYNSSSQAPTEMATAHSPTSSLNPPGFNPWSAPLRASGRAAPPQKITPPAGYTSSSASGGPLNTTAGPTLSPILPSAVSPAPRPSVSPAPRPTSSTSLHAILQRENAPVPQPAKRSGSGEGAGPMELDPPTQHMGFRHPSLAPLNHEGK